MKQTKKLRKKAADSRPPIQKRFLLTGPQQRFCRSVLKGKRRYNAFVGGVGSGKTYAGCICAINLSMAYNGNRGLIASGTERQLEDTVQRQFFDLLEHFNLSSHIVTRSKSEQRVLLSTGSEILFRSMETHRRLFSLNLGWFYIDEAGTVDAKGFKTLMGRLRLSGAFPRVGFITSNPDNGWLKEVFVEKKWTKDVYKVQAKTESNHHLPEEYAADLRKAFTGGYAKRYLDGVFAPLDGLVYDGFDAKRHVVKGQRPPAEWRRFRAIDFGYVNPFVCLFFAEAPDGRLFLYDEYVAQGRLMEEHARVIHQRSGAELFEATYADHDAQDRAQLEAAGIRTQPARKELSLGVAEVVRRLGQTIQGQPALTISATCVRTLAEITQYRWDESRGGREAPVKENDHCMDALRYGLMSRAASHANKGPSLLTLPRRRSQWN